MESNTPEVTDAEHVKRARQGRPAERKSAFTALVIRHETYVRNLLRQLSRDEALAEEMAQDAFVIAWQKLASLKNPDGFGAWVRRIAYREFLHMLRRRKLEAAYLESIDVGLSFVEPFGIQSKQQRFDDPQIAVAVIVENGGSGGAAAAPIARKVMDQYLLQEGRL